ncbi:SDR family NAD(P)-dependent oxidoreductase [Actinomadura graeca]|uniref:SDR family NAD(P)-dependent oxidoreductase n=1 Tax=Actinomadura graeca TaxID=2750812 RepID=A0ABX8R026_9ACTN|nr:SDR family NAD(P)-dependent oxidoreductase [Actinomadura graeca]QXJ23921.1 SDR family NAD(P)-dependent oxidoreductase [Actinomadura graeca]
MNANETALVTGGNKGIGRAIVHALARRGLVVYLGARSPERGRSAVEELRREPGLDVRFAHLDVTDPRTVETAVKAIEADTGRLDVLVNNAGIAAGWDVGAADVTAAHLREVYEVNVFGVVTVTSACVPLLRRSGNPRIVNVSGGPGSLTFLSDPDHPLTARASLAYSSSKAALNALTLIYADALRADGIKVNAAGPGLVPTDQNAAAPFPRGDRTAADGAVVPSLLATIPADGPTGVFRGPDSLDDVVPW